MPSPTAGAIERLTTRGGELAALAWTDVGEVTCSVAGVAGDNFTLVKGMCAQIDWPAFVADLRELVLGLETGDDPLRRRMFVYEPPPGWRGRRLALSSRWYPPGCPRDREYFEVFDAMPVGDLRGSQTFDLAVDRSGPRGVAVETGERYRYELHHVDPDGRGLHRAAFARVVASVERLPGVQVSTPSREPLWLF